MLGYADRLAQLGSYAGGTAGFGAGAAGGGFLGRLGDFLEPLDAPRQAAYNLVRSAYRGLSGDGSLDDVVSAAPGVLGTALAAGLGVSGFGLPLALLAGSALGGTTQYAGKALDEQTDKDPPNGQPPHVNRFKAPTPADLLELLGGDRDDTLGSMAVGMAADPLTYAFGALGRLKGAQAGAQAGTQYGTRLENIARTMGPEYAGGAEKLAGITQTPAFAALDPEKQALLRQHITDILSNPASSDILKEIPQGSQYLGHGVETVALRTPSGGVVGLTTPSHMTEDGLRLGQPVLTRPDLEGVLQAARSRPFAGSVVEGELTGAPVRVEHTPMIETLGNRSGLISDEFRQGRDLLKQQLRDQGVMWSDAHFGNFGRLSDGSWRILDPGGIEMVNPGATVPRMAEMPFVPGTALERALLRGVGATDRVRAELEADLSWPSCCARGQPAGLDQP